MKVQIRSRRRRLGRWLTVALAAALLAVPTALAEQELGQYSSDGPRTGPLSDQGPGFSTDGPRTGLPQVSEPVFSTDGPRTGIPSATPTEQPVVGIETALRQLRGLTGVTLVGGPAAGFEPPPASIAVAPPVADDSGGFQWADAGVGVAIALGGIVVLTLIGLAVLSYRRHEAPWHWGHGHP